MKKLLLCLMLFLSSLCFGIEVIKSETLVIDEKEIGEIYVAKFDTQEEKENKLLREKKYMMEKDEFDYFFDRENKGGVAYKAAYSTPFGYTISFKAFCGDIYISVYGGYMNFDELLNIFLETTDAYKYDFK